MTGSPLPPDAILLHIGPHKTGTTAIQGMLAAARPEMLAAGVLYPGQQGAHHNAARAVTANREGWSHDSRDLDGARWTQLVDATRAATGRVVISSEFFALANPERRRRIVEDLGRDRVHVVIAARNPGSIALSTWQQVLRDGKTAGLEGWLHEQFERPAPTEVMSNQGFWSWADPATQVAKWSEVVDLDRIRVVVIDEKDKVHLPRSFEQLLDLAPGTLSSHKPPLSNRSLTVPEAELLERAIARTRDELTWNEFSTLFRFGFASHMLRNRTPAADEARAALPDWAADQARQEAEDIVRRLAASGATVLGDPQHLTDVPAGGALTAPETVSVDLAADALAGVVLSAKRRIRVLEERLAQEENRRRVDSVGSRELSRVIARRVARKAKGRLRGRKK